MRWADRALDELRRRLAHGAHASSSKIFLRDPYWREPLLSSIVLRPHDRVLDVGDAIAKLGPALLERSPETSVTTLYSGAEPANLAANSSDPVRGMVTGAKDRPGGLPYPAVSFDKVVGAMAFYRLLPEEKLHLAREMHRVLRRGGTIHLAEMDRPENEREAHFLEVAAATLGADRTALHLDGTWLSVLSQAGFVGVRRLSTHSVITAQVAVVRGRRR